MSKFWSVKKSKSEFQSFLAQIDHENDRNMFFNPKSSRFGSYAEMAVILAMPITSMT